MVGIMAVHNADIARAFEEIADLLELRDENPFRVRAYRNAARVVGELTLDVARTPDGARRWTTPASRSSRTRPGA
jgi:DNA polymerase/3'-5' exonuclease PolX